MRSRIPQNVINEKISARCLRGGALREFRRRRSRTRLRLLWWSRDREDRRWPRGCGPAVTV